MDNYETNIFQQPYVLIKLIDIIFKKFSNLFYTIVFNYLTPFKYKTYDDINLLDNAYFIEQNEEVINKNKLIISMNYRIKNNSIFQNNVKKLKKQIKINDISVKKIKELLKKEIPKEILEKDVYSKLSKKEIKIISFHYFFVIKKYNEILERKKKNKVFFYS
jgi:hypothetical protein